MKGMEMVILKFFLNLSSKREKILNKESLEKTRFKWELKRLEFSINYERGSSYGVKALGVGGKRGLSMNLKLVSWNV